MMTKQDNTVTPSADESKEAGTMAQPPFTTFCCCLGLETGAKIVGVLHLLVSLSFIVLCSIYASKFGGLAGTTEDAGDGIYTTYYKITLAVTGVSFVHLFLACALLYGAFKRNTLALRTWVLVMSALICLALLSIVVNCALSGTSPAGPDVFLAFVEGLLFFCFLAYCILCVHSFYLMLKSCEDMQGPTNTPY